MEKMNLNYHLKLQEMCDCYLETDFLSEMQGMAEADSKDVGEDAIKYLALAIMFAIAQKAEKCLSRKRGKNSRSRSKTDPKKNCRPRNNAIQIQNYIFELFRCVRFAPAMPLGLVW